MLLKSYRSVLTASVVFIGGMILAVSQPSLVLANDRVEYTPTDRPRPEGTQGGGSRLYLGVTSLSDHSQALQNPILKAMAMFLI